MKVVKHHKKCSSLYTKATLKAFADAMIPEDIKPSNKHGNIQAFGAVEYNIDEYQAQSLNQSFTMSIFDLNIPIHLGRMTAKILDEAAKQLINTGENKEGINFTVLSEKGEFAALSPNDRFRAISLLERQKVNPMLLPFPFWNNHGLILSVINITSMFCTLGYYSGWSQFTNPCIETIENFKPENLPIGWRQVGYPGPAKGYHAMRGYLVDKFTE